MDCGGDGLNGPEESVTLLSGSTSSSGTFTGSSTALLG